MSNVIGMGEFAGMANAGCPNCWLCQKAVSTRALFCHHCGTVQPVRDQDHYARLGLERRFDVDLNHLERQFSALLRTLEPSRFLIRGLGERGHAAKQLEALTLSYETLRDPMRRCRYWLEINEPNPSSPASFNSVLAVGLRQAMEGVSEACDCDRVAQRAGQLMQESLLGLMQALRTENWAHAWTNLADIEGIEALLGDIHSRRAELSSAPK